MYQPRDTTRSADSLAEELYAERRPYLLRIARRHCRREADAEDALQEAFAAFISGYDPGGGAPALAWITLTLKRACWRRNEWRAVDVEPLALAEVLVEEALDPAPRVAERLEARKRLGALKRDERVAIVLHAAGFSYEEIGERRGWTHTKVNRCLYEGRRGLQED
ncbi:MAG TPA: sigma-70 family RNA polymerase sigma factor [Solirubrobacterales bacterium]|nr:sigma-70 family RNA polymerase sigma factor [Solirubrobacterales bacterium]